MRGIIAGLVLILGFAASAAAQGNGLVASHRVATISETQVNRRMDEVFGASAPERLRGSLNLYKVTYRSVDANGRATSLSGMVVIPSDGAPNGLIVFNHGTMAYNGTVPSKLTAKTKGGDAEVAMLAFASGGYAIAMPDYIGQGDNGGGHPYPASVTNARAGIDLIKPARAVARKNRLEIGSNLYITGYSEGGGVAMAQTRELERSNDPAYAVTASAPAAGPYDLSGATLKWMIAQPTDQVGFITRTYLLGYMVYSLHKVKGVKITDYFKPSMAFAINNSYGGKTKDEDIIKRIGVTAVLMRSKNNLFKVTTPRFKRVAESADVKDPAIRLLRDNNCFDWSPRSRMLMIYLEGDAIVTDENSKNAFRTMRNRGVGRDTMRRSVIKDSSLNHLTAMPIAMIRARNFFDRGFAGVRDLDEN
ncbi:MAG: hypothetical protein R2682_05915 [Pyrinomonadaceae bacterium]